MSGKSELASAGMTLAQIGQAYVHAIVDNGGTDEDAKRIIGDFGLKQIVAQVALGKVKIVLETVEPKPVASYCQSLSKGKKVIIGATNGRAIIAKAQETFPGYLDGDYVNYGTDVPGRPTKRTRVEVLELVKDGNFAQIYGGFGRSRDSLCLTQSQIIRFVKDHSLWLRRDGYGTFFLFKVDELKVQEESQKFFVANVRWYEGRLEAYVCRLSYGHVWSAEFRHRIVVPQL